MLQTRKIKEKDSEIQAVPVEIKTKKKKQNKKTQTNQVVMNTHQISVLAHLQSKQTHSQSVVGMQGQIRHWSSELAVRLRHFCILYQAVCNSLSHQHAPEPIDRKMRGRGF